MPAQVLRIKIWMMTKDQGKIVRSFEFDETEMRIPVANGVGPKPNASMNFVESKRYSLPFW